MLNNHNTKIWQMDKYKQYQLNSWFEIRMDDYPIIFERTSYKFKNLLLHDIIEMNVNIKTIHLHKQWIIYLEKWMR